MVPIPHLRVLHEDPDIIVIDKPAGLAVHTAVSQQRETDTVVDQLLVSHPKLRGIGEDPERPGIVHRLDKDTSGVMVVAKTQVAFTKLKQAFKHREVNKTYLALVEGSPEWEDQTIAHAIARTGSGRFGARHPRDVATLPKSAQDSYRPATTAFKVRKRYAGYTLLEAYPATGRTHQIRVHLKVLGYPIVGDRIYGSKKAVDRAAAALGLSRQFLHAVELSFTHPTTRKQVSFVAALPADLQSVLDTLTTNA